MNINAEETRLAGIEMAFYAQDRDTEQVLGLLSLRTEGRQR